MELGYTVQGLAAVTVLGLDNCRFVVAGPAKISIELHTVPMHSAKDFMKM